MSAAPGQPVPAACGDWAATKAAYRFFDNPRVTEHGMLAGHFAATAVRCAASEGPILILQDTTEFIYSRAQPGKIGFTKTINAGRYKAGQPNVVTLCGVLMHSSLAVTLSGTPLGLTAAKFWTRTKFKGTWTLKRHVNPTRVPIETKESYRWLENLRQSMALVGAPERCVHVADRESDIYELFCLAQDLGTRFLVRVQTNRLAGTPADAEPRDGAHRVFAQLSATPWAGRHYVAIGQDAGGPSADRIGRGAVIVVRAWIGWQAMAVIRLQPRWKRPASKACITSSCVTTRVRRRRPRWKCSSSGSRSCLPSVSRNIIQPST